MSICDFRGRREISDSTAERIYHKKRDEPTTKNIHFSTLSNNNISHDSHVINAINDIEFFDKFLA